MNSIELFSNAARKVSFILIFLLGTCLTCTKPTMPPNIVIILADDMGFSDLGCTGSEIETPNLDALAKDGILFTNCYNTSRCCPTRASLLTGLYQHQAGYGYMDSDLGYPSYQGRFREGVVTVAQLLQEADFRTMMLGKWHLGHEDTFSPLARGFDRMYGIPKGGGVYFYPCIGRDRQVYLNETQVFPDSNWYSTDAFTDYALEFVQEAKVDQKAFFMYLAYIAPHFPLQAKDEDIQKYKGKYSKGYSYYRNQRFQKQKELGVIPTNTKMSQPDFEPWDSIENKEEEDLKMAVYAAQVDRMDQNIGRLIQQLKELEIFDNTVILFLSDNGGTNTQLHQYPEARIGSRNCWSAYGRNWGNVSNTPYRKYKAMTHEGGIISPMIVHWPQGISSKGKITREPVHITDLAPTILSLAGIRFPSSFKGQALQPLAGTSVTPLFHNARQGNTKSMFFEHMGNKAVRIGDWKLVKQRKQEWELYNLREDPTEHNDLTDHNPEQKEKLLKAYQIWASKNEVREWPVTRK